MSTNHHSAHSSGEALTSTLQNAPLSSLDTAITNIIGTDSSNPLYRIGASSELTIASGAVTITDSHHTIDTEGDASSDDLDTMTIATSNVFGVIRAENGARDVVIKHGTGNILTWNGSDVTLDDTNKALLYYYDGTNVRVLSVITATGGAISGSTGATDNAIIRADGTGGSTVQASSPLIDDSGNITNVNGVRSKAQTELTIATGAVTITQDFHTIDTEGDASTDDLATISGGTTGDTIWISANNGGRTVVVKHATGNILTWDGNDISLDETRKMLQLKYDGTNWTCVTIIGAGAGAGGLYASLAILQDQKSTTTDGGSASATTWNARDLNAEVTDDDNIVTISSNQFTPISGDYEIFVLAPAFDVDSHRLRLYNVTGTASVKEGMSSLAASASNESSLASLAHKFTANGTDAYRIDHYTQTARATNGLGASTDDGSNEVYTTIVLRKLN